MDFLAHAGEPLLAGSLKRLLILARLGWGEILAEAKYAGAGYIVVAVTQDAALESLKLLVSVLSTTGVWVALDGGTTVCRRCAFAQEVSHLGQTAVLEAHFGRVATLASEEFVRVILGGVGEGYGGWYPAGDHGVGNRGGI